MYFRRIGTEYSRASTKSRGVCTIGTVLPWLRYTSARGCTLFLSPALRAMPPLTSSRSFWLGLAVLWLGVLTVAPGARAQSAEHLVERWTDELRAALAAVETVRYTEHVVHEVDGPFATRRTRLVHDVTLEDRRLHRHLRQAEIDGEPVESERLAHGRKRMRHAMGRDIDLFFDAGDLPVHMLAEMRPVGTPTREDVNDRSAWRVELLPQRGEDTVERATLWLSRGRTPRLLRSRLLLRGEEPGTVITVTTDYRTVAGPSGLLALPHRQLTEGVLQQQRRWRTFTVLLTTERVLEDVDVRWHR